MLKNPGQPIRVLVVDDHALVREGMISFLRKFPDIELVGEAANGIEALKFCEDCLPDVVLMDLVMPDMDGIAATTAIRDAYPETQVIALTGFREGELVEAALQAGAISYLLKNVTAGELSDAIRAAHRGKHMLSPEATEVLIHKVTEGHNGSCELSHREVEVLTLMALGRSNAAIAGQLCLSRATVKNHVSNILSKMSVSSRTEAVSLALQRGLIHLT